MGKRRTTFTAKLNLDAEIVNSMIYAYLQKQGFKPIVIKKENVWHLKPTSLSTPICFGYTYTNGTLVIEAWVRDMLIPGIYMGESRLTGVSNFIIKNEYSHQIRKLIDMLYEIKSKDEYTFNPEDYKSNAPMDEPEEKFDNTSPGSAYKYTPKDSTTKTNSKSPEGYASNGITLCIIALVISIVSFNFTGKIVSLIIGVLGIKYCKMGLESETKNSTARKGIVIGIIAECIAIITLVIYIIFFTVL